MCLSVGTHIHCSRCKRLARRDLSLPLPAHEQSCVVTAELSPDGTSFVTLTSDGAVCMFACPSLAPLLSFSGDSVRLGSGYALGFERDPAYVSPPPPLPPMRHSVTMAVRLFALVAPVLWR